MNKLIDTHAHLDELEDLAAEYREEHRRAVREAACDRLLLETDSPVAYGRETKYESRPVDVLRSLRAVANLKGVDEAVVAEQTTKNAIAFFSLDAGIQSAGG